MKMQIKPERTSEVTCTREKLGFRISKQGTRKTTTFFRYSSMDSGSFGERCTKTFSVLSLIFTGKFTHFHRE